MFKKYFPILGIIFGFSSSLISSPVNAAKDPYTYAYVSFAINFCATEYGIFRDSEAFENINSFMKDEFNMEPWQVYNLQQRKGFFVDASAYIKKSGGCSTIVADLKERINSQPRGFAGLKNKKSNKSYIYKTD